MTTMRTRKALCAATLIAALTASGCASLDSRSSAGQPGAAAAWRRRLAADVRAEADDPMGDADYDVPAFLRRQAD